MGVSDDFSQDMAIGRVLGGEYQVIRFLGAGAMGAVYEVEGNDGTHYALKAFLHLDQFSDPKDVVSRIVREAKVCSTLSHEHVVPVIDASLDQELEIPFMIMPLLTGFDLETLLDRRGALHPTVAVRIALQACRGLQAAHATGVIHRDVKPSNLYIHHERDGSVTVKVCDFGIAKWSLGGDDLTRTGSTMGTPLYMSPEQVMDSKNVTVQTDVWSLAMTLYHALAGHPAFERVSGISGLLDAITTKQAPHLQEAAPWLDPSLAVIVHGALVRDCKQRCPDIASFAAALEPFAGDSLDLNREGLMPVPQEMRDMVADRARLPDAWRPVAPSLETPKDLLSHEQKEDPLVGTTLGGQYPLIGLIGRGGMAAVYDARTADNQTVAVKVISKELVGSKGLLRRRFVREARALTAVSSPYIVKILDADTDPGNGLPYIVMERLNGTDLHHIVKKWGALEPAPVVRLFTQVCRGLAEAHRLGLVHRDVKPANIFLHELPTGEVVPKICDFGIAKRILAEESASTVELTETGGMVGSPAYMSPEQVRNAKRVDARSDVWSLGITLWEMLSGRRPWEEDTSVGELILAICTEPVARLDEVAPWVEPGLAVAVHRCLEVKPDARYATVEELADALEPFALTQDKVRRDMIVPVSGGQAVAAATDSRAKATVAHGAAAKRVTDSTATYPAGAVVSGISQETKGPVAKPRPTKLYAAAAGAAVLITIASVWAWRGSRHSDPPVGIAPVHSEPTAVTPPENSGPSVEVAPVSTVIPVQPPEAKVTVDGIERQLVDGGLPLAGEPGTSFRVVAIVDAREIDTVVVIKKDGTTTPDKIHVPDAPTKPAATKPSHAGTKTKPKPTGKPTATSKPKPTQTVKPIDTW